MKIFVNGEPRETPAPNVESFIAELGFARGTVMVEINGTALRPDEWATQVNEGDRVELLRIAAGG